MANNIQLKRSSVPGRIPDAASILVGEPVVNLADKIIYTKDGTGNVIIIGSSSGTGNVSVSSSIGYTNSTTTAFPEGDYANSSLILSNPLSESATDIFGALTSTAYDCMEPRGSTNTKDLGIL